jgi:myo-inositol catabolism protein IolC
VYLLRLDPHLPWQPAAVEAAKRAMYDGFRAAADGNPLRDQFGIIVDGRSTMILRDAIEQGFRTVCTVDSVGSERDSDDSGECLVHPFACEATYWRVVVRFNPSDESGLTPRQLGRLQRLSAGLRRPFGPRLLCDLVVPPTEWQLMHGIRAFDRELLPELTSRAIAWLVDAGVAPELWAIEGLGHPADYERVVTIAMRHAHTVGCLIRAAGHSDATTFELMAVGQATPGICGVVLGPAPFWEPAIAWMTSRTTRSRAVGVVAEQFRSWVDRLEAARTRPLPEPNGPGETPGALRLGIAERADAGSL